MTFNRDTLETARHYLSNIHVTLMTIAVVLMAGAMAWVLYLILVHNTDPVRSTRIVSIVPEDRIIDRSKPALITVVREVCARRDAQVEVIRTWAEADANDGVKAISAFSSFYLELKEGCQNIGRTQTVPSDLNLGNKVFETSIKACNIIGHCVVHRMEPVPVQIVGLNTTSPGVRSMGDTGSPSATPSMSSSPPTSDPGRGTSP